MSDSTKPESTASPAGESVQEIKGEFTRKLTNTEAKIEETRQTLSAQIAQMNELLSKVVPQQTQSAPSGDVDLNTMIFDNPAKALALVEERTERKIMEKLQSQQAQQSKHQAVLSQLAQDFPELAQASNALTKRALELHAELAPEDKLSPASYRAAVYQAASELGVSPSKKRKNTDDFSLGGGNGGSPNAKKSKLTDDALVFAKLMGLDVEKEEVRKRLEKHAERNGKLGGE